MWQGEPKSIANIDRGGPWLYIKNLNFGKFTLKSLFFLPPLLTSVGGHGRIGPPGSATGDGDSHYCKSDKIFSSMDTKKECLSIIWSLSSVGPSLWNALSPTHSQNLAGLPHLLLSKSISSLVTFFQIKSSFIAMHVHI